MSSCGGLSQKGIMLLAENRTVLFGICFSIYNLNIFTIFFKSLLFPINM